MRVATFNLQNLRLRLRDGRPVLDGAADGDVPGADRPADLARSDRIETARVLAAARADVVALQEVFDRPTLDHFHDAFLQPAGAEDYPFRYCLPGNDGRGLNVGALSRRRPVAVVSHAGLTGSEAGLDGLPADLRDRPIFRRDCLELDLGTVSIFVCHFKAPYPDEDRAFTVREAEARAVRRIVEMRFPDPAGARWIVLGDFNEPARRAGGVRSALTPLTEGFAVDLLDRLPRGEDWTFEVPDTHLHTRPDRIFVSPRLAQEHPAARPRIIRSGMGSADTVPMPPHASDHALVLADFPGL